MGVRLDLAAVKAAGAIMRKFSIAPEPTDLIRANQPVISIKVGNMSPFEKRLKELKGSSKVNEIHSEIASRYSTAMSKACNEEVYLKERRIKTAEHLGLEPIGRGSAFAELVAVHPELPDVVLKVVDEDEAGAAYAKACFEKKIDSIHAPVIHAYHEVEGKAFIYMERLIDLKDMPEDCSERMEHNNLYMLDYQPEDCLYEADSETLPDYRYQFWRWNAEYDYSEDFHNGNAMFRADGTWVCIDPVS